MELTYTPIDWIIGVNVAGANPLAFEDLSVKQQVTLGFNIWPGGQSFLHELSRQREGHEITNIESAANLFDACKNFDPANLANGPKTEVAEDSMGNKTERDVIELPILPNIYGFTALDYCVPFDGGYFWFKPY